MAKNSNKKGIYVKKKTNQGSGKFSKTPNAGGERFQGSLRSGTPPSRARRRKKPSRGQG
tara:strand:- start:575 stop:751 length:177 start_codon:yes stop_codon:yes gene_type:complete